ncbi:hypothetical protein CBR_g31963 [Chara braunii]|uniref:Secreted protein n=1 Tax=Chara braunii TaxID=69332 RepID=A0A388LG63_CHABU|nr:hypothetical protein CBR_g31963 [Chara braunii]|eukprot:GBG81288.1 hypothetical protein CBR_g31963 [Chara braunii]
MSSIQSCFILVVALSVWRTLDLTLMAHNCKCFQMDDVYLRSAQRISVLGVLLCRAVLCRSVPCRVVPCRAVLCRVMPCRAVSCRAVLFFSATF